MINRKILSIGSGIIILAILSLSSATVFAEVIEFQDGVYPTPSYSGTRDTTIRDDNAITNYGNSSSCKFDSVAPKASSLIKWDISDIPSGSTVLTVTITFNITNTTNDTYNIYEMKGDWVEGDGTAGSGATWESFDGTYNWAIAGAQDTSDRGSTVLGSISAPGTPPLYKTITLNSDGVVLVQWWLDNPSTNYGIIIQNYSAPGDGCDFTSREGTTASERPQLTITYTPSTTAVSAYGSGIPTVPPAYISKGSTNKCLGTFRFDGAGIISEIVITEYGTSNAQQDLENVKLYQDDGDGNWETTQDTTQLGATTTFDAGNKATFSGFSLNAGTNSYVHVILDVKTGIAYGATIGIEINDSSEITSTTTVSATSWPVQLGTSTISDITTVSGYAGGSPSMPPQYVNVETTKQCLGTFKFSDQGTVSGITISEYGTCNAEKDLGNIKLYWDDDGDGNWEENQDTTQLGITTTFNSSNKATFSGFNIPASDITYVHVVLDVKDSILKNETIGIEIEQAADVTSTVGVNAFSWPVQLGVSTVRTLYPYLQDVTQNSIKVMWITDTAQDSNVDYGLTTSYDCMTTDATPVTVHGIPLSGLQTNTTYHYRITSGGVSSADCTFKTAPSSNTGFTFIAYGDNRANSSGAVFQYDFESVNQATTLHNPKTIVVHVGDSVYTGSQDEWQPQFFLPARNIFKNNVLYPAVGNHEAGTAWFDNYFSPPQGGGSGTKRYYSFNYGNTHFIALDTNHGYISGTAQYNWLVNDLDSPATTGAKWIIVFFHYPAYSSRRQYLDVRNNFVPLFESKKVDLVLAGDDHFYERYYHNGIYYLITAGGGATLADEGTYTQYRDYHQSVFHYCIIEVGTTHITTTAYDNSNNAFDTFTLSEPSSGSSGKHKHKSSCGLMGPEVLLLIGLIILIRKKR